MMHFGFLITVLAVKVRLFDFLQPKWVVPLAGVIPYSRPPVVHVNGQEANTALVPPCCGCFLEQLHS